MMQHENSEYLIIEPYPKNIDACDHCGCFKGVMYVDSQVVCDECFDQFFFQEGQK